jgi:hypothetical protein
MWSMFLSSYAPLFFLVGVRSIESARGVAAVCGLLVIVGAVGTVALLRTAPRKARHGYRLLEVEKRDADVAAYAATYLLPFLTVFTGRWQDVVSLAAFVGFLGFVYVRSRLIYVNPVLLVLGFHLWRVIPATLDAAQDSTAVRWPRYLLADSVAIRQGQSIWAYSVTDDLLLYESEVDIRGRPEEAQEQDKEAW